MLGQEQWVRVPDVARHLDVSVSWVNHAVATGSFPVRRVGRSIRFRISEIDAWVTANGVGQ